MLVAALPVFTILCVRRKACLSVGGNARACQLLRHGVKMNTTTMGNPVRHQVHL